MQIRLASVLVDDQDKALAFYTGVLGFLPSKDIPMGEFRWLTVTSPDGPQEIELLLEPNANPAARVYQKALFEQGIPLTAFGVKDVQKEYERLANLGVEFLAPPTEAGPTTIAAFNDMCGNLIQIFQL